MAACTSDPSQQLVKEAAGSSPKPNAVVHLRVSSSDSCLEPDQLADASNQPNLRTYPCADSSRVQQLLVPLTNGQIRPLSAMNRCVDAKNGAEDEGLFVTGCTTPATRDAQKFDVDATGLRTRAVSGGVRRCVQAVSDGARATQKVCTAAPEQQWTFVPVVP